MTPTISTEDAVQFFAASGWQQFFLNERFEICPPLTTLAGFCKVSPATLAGKLFLNLFSYPSREKLRLQLADLPSTPARPMASLALVLQPDCGDKQPVEIMLYPQPDKETGSPYIGFIRPLPETFLNSVAEYPAQPPTPPNRHVETLINLSERLRDVLDLPTLLNYVVETLYRQAGFKYCVVYLVDDTETTLSVQSVSNTALETVAPINLKVDRQTAVGQAVATGLPVQLNHATDQATGQVSMSPGVELAIPLVFAGQVLGVLNVRGDGPPGFDNDEVSFLQVVANQLAIAIQNIHLFEERDRHIAELAVFNQIGMALIGRQDLQSMLSIILRRLSALLQVEGVSLMLLEADGLHFAVAVGVAADEIKSFVLKPGQGIAWSVVDTRQTIRVDNVSQDPRHFNAIDSATAFKTRSLLAVPVQIQERVLGVIEVMNRLDGHPFSRDNEATLEFIASAIAVAIENARLFQETQKQLIALTTLTEASEVITKAPDLDQLLYLVLDFALSIIRAEIGAIILTEGPFPSLRIRAARGFDEDKIELFNRLNLSQYVGIWGETYRTKQLIEIKDTATDPRVFASPEVAWIFPQSFTSVPLLSQDDCIGLIVLHALPTNNDTRALLKAVADMAAVTIDKARLFKETTQWLAEVLTLYTLSDQLTKMLDLNHIADASVTILQHALECDNCYLFLTEQSGNTERMALKARSGRHESPRNNVELTYITKLANGRIHQPHPIYIENVTKPNPAGLSWPEAGGVAGVNEQRIHLRSVLVVPLIAKEELLGALAIDDRQPNAFGQSESRLLTIAAAQISTAIENSSLYDDLARRAVELELALEEVREANRLKSEFVQNVSHELRTPLTFVQAYV
ncbi:MAG: GAF domain-containing protein, partial [Chloroflexota bacterium]